MLELDVQAVVLGTWLGPGLVCGETQNVRNGVFAVCSQLRLGPLTSAPVWKHHSGYIHYALLSLNGRELKLEPLTPTQVFSLAHMNLPPTAGSRFPISRVARKLQRSPI